MIIKKQKMSSAAVLTLTVGIVVLVFMFYVSYKNYSNRVDYLMGRGFYALMPKSYLDYLVRQGGAWVAFFVGAGLITIAVLLPKKTVEIPVAVLADEQEIQKKQSRADELIKYKELLDSGVLTQEEFDTKKKEILERST